MQEDQNELCELGWRQSISHSFCLKADKEKPVCTLGLEVRVSVRVYTGV